MRKRKQGVITVMICMLLIGMLTLICAAAEAVRVVGARTQSEETADSAMDSLFSEYHRQLMESYDLFFISGVYDGGSFSPVNLTDRFQEYMAYNLQPEQADPLLNNTDFWRLTVTECEAVSYCLATDGGGIAYRQQAADSMKETVAGDLLEKLLSWEKTPFNVEELEQSLTRREAQSEQEIRRLEQAREAEENGETDAPENPDAKEQGETAASGEKDAAEQIESPADRAVNPIEVIRGIKEKGILWLILPKDFPLSEKSLAGADLPSKRSLHQGDGISGSTNGLSAAANKVLFREYLIKKFSNALNKKDVLPQGETALSCELEYILAGKDSDPENVKTVVHRLLLIREAVNFAYLMTDTSRQIQAETAAVAITGLLGAAPLAEAVKYGILLAWAYGESIADLQNLMAGGSLSPVKTGANWRLSLEKIGELGERTAGKGIKEQGGLDYEDYLRLLLYGEKDETITMRSLDLIEQNIKKQDGNRYFKADGLVCGLKIKTTFGLQPLFFSFRFLENYVYEQTLTVTSAKQY